MIPKIELNHAYKAFNKDFVLNNLNLQVQAGETKVIIGRSGAGKSVLLKSIVGLLRLDSGTVKIDGIDTTHISERDYNKIRQDIGMVFQGGALFDSMTVGENVAFVLNEFRNLSREEVNRRVAEALGMVGLKGIEDMPPSQLSGGMKKRVSLARVLCMEPKIILYDEPTSEVDPITADAINNLIIDMRNKLKVTSIVVTHDMNSAFKVADSIAMVYRGQVIAEGSPDEIRHTKHPVVKQFIYGEAQGPITDDESLVFGHAR